MKVILPRIELLEGLKKIAQVMSVNNNGIYNNIKLTVENNKVTFTGGDADKTLVVTLDNEDAVTILEGSVLLDYKQFSNFVRKSKAKKVTINHVDDSQINIKAGNIEYNSVIQDINEYPSLPEINAEAVSINVDHYVEALKNTAFTVAKFDSRPVLKGVCIEVDKGNIKFVGTDSHRLGKYEVNVNSESYYRKVIDGKSLSKTLKLINKNTTNVNLTFDEQYSKVSFNDIDLYMKNYEGNYPDTSRLIPEDFKSSIELNSHELLESLSQLETISKNNRNNVVKLSSKDGIKLTASDVGNINMNASVNGKTHGDDITISFSNHYLSEAIKALGGNYIKISFTGNLRPFVVQNSDNKALQLVLPVRTY